MHIKLFNNTKRTNCGFDPMRILGLVSDRTKIKDKPEISEPFSKETLDYVVLDRR